MLIPYNRIMTMLGMVKGPLVSAWVQDYLDTIEQEVVQHRENAEILWTNFENALDDAFKDTNEEDDAITRLEHLEMKKGNLAQYTAKFNRLRKKAGWDADSNGTIRMYKRGLDLGLLTSMLKQVGANPNTLRGWQELATQHHDVYQQLKHEISFRKDVPRLASQLMAKKKETPPQKDPWAMDIDATRTDSVKADEKQRLRKEGRCFFCKEQGHLSRDCPKKKGQSNPKPPQQPRARANRKEDDKTTQVGNDDDPIQMLRSIRAKIGKGAFNGALDGLVEEEDF
jgi:Retrotransposon gag protein/Zinc knuckle